MDTPQTTDGTATQAPERPPDILWQLVRYFLRLGTLALLWRWKKIPEPFIVLGAAVIGLVVYSALHR